MSDNRPDPHAAPNTGYHHVAVDLTPMLPGGESGGAKLVALTLARHLGQVAPDWRFTLLTLGRTHDELAVLEEHNVRRLPVDIDPIDPAQLASDAKSRGSARYRRGRLLRDIGADLLFCPLTASSVYSPGVPVVSIIYDLQHLTYPTFFTASERAVRDHQVCETVQVADRIVCISDFTRLALIEHAKTRDGQVLTIPIAHAGTLGGSVRWTDTTILEQLGIESGRFLLYPANFWPHKNHRLLLTAFALYRARHPRSDLVLVCTGAPNLLRDDVRRAARLAGVSQKVRFPGFVTKAELAALMQASLAVVYPSLYEGFGMPVVEAMAYGTPVLTSNAASLPEAAGDAALTFDPNRVVEMMTAIERIDQDVDLRVELATRGRARAATFDEPEQMARQYLEVLHAAMGASRAAADRLHGVYADGWTSERVVVSYVPSPHDRFLDIVLTAPPWLPFSEVRVEVLADRSDRVQTYSLRCQESVRIHQLLAREGGSIDIVFARVFDQYAYGLGENRGTSGCIVQGCSIVSADGAIDLLAESRCPGGFGAASPVD
jgi:glycosyltransferase involved in cell wall biosynthesis